VNAPNQSTERTRPTAQAASGTAQRSFALATLWASRRGEIGMTKRMVGMLVVGVPATSSLMMRTASAAPAPSAGSAVALTRLVPLGHVRPNPCGACSSQPPAVTRLAPATMTVSSLTMSAAPARGERWTAPLTRLVPVGHVRPSGRMLVGRRPGDSCPVALALSHETTTSGHPCGCPRRHHGWITQNRRLSDDEPGHAGHREHERPIASLTHRIPGRSRVVRAAASGSARATCSFP
jgi:hypothetical protein